MTTLILAVAMCLTPQGHRLTLAGDSFRTTAELDQVRWPAESLRHIAQNPGGWRKLALEADDPFVWPLDQWVFASTDHGPPVAATELFAATPEHELWIVRLGREPLLLRPDKLFRLRYRSGYAVMLFARFPTAAKITGIAVAQRDPSEGR